MWGAIFGVVTTIILFIYIFIAFLILGFITFSYLGFKQLFGDENEK